MKIECPSCNLEYKIDESKIPEKGAYARCKSCGNRIFVQKETQSELKKCPKCGRGEYQQDAIECQECGIIFEKYIRNRNEEFRNCLKSISLKKLEKLDLNSSEITGIKWNLENLSKNYPDLSDVCRQFFLKYEQITIAINHKKYDKAIKLLNALKAEFPDFSDVANRKINQLIESQNNEKKIKNYFDLGVEAYNEQRFYDAFELFREIINEPQAPENINEYIKDIEKALNIKISPQNAEKNLEMKQLLGIGGSILLFIGVFTPIVSWPAIGNINYIQNGKGDGTLILILAVISLVLVLTKKYRELWFTGIGSLGNMLLTFINFQAKRSQVKVDIESKLAGNPFCGLADMAIQSIQLQWGWALLIVGAALVLASAAMKDI